MKKYFNLRFIWILLALGIFFFGFAPRVEFYCQTSVDPEMVEVKGGTFIMGQIDGEGDEKPQHIVTIKDFSMAKFEITVAEYRKFCISTDRDMPPVPEWGWIDNHPIINTSWNDANAYIDWLNLRTKQNYRLPTEAEFEYVLRNGTATGAYPWGSGMPQNENLADETFRARSGRSGIWKNYDDGFAYTAPVGSFEPNNYGVHDINGNIWEWCRDWYGEYSKQKVSDPTGSISGTYKIGRGGSYDADPWHSRIASRAFVEPSFKRPGFRLVREK